jgi:hypothetical protein
VRKLCVVLYMDVEESIVPLGADNKETTVKLFPQTMSEPFPFTPLGRFCDVSEGQPQILWLESLFRGRTV